MNTLEEAVAQITQFLGMHPCDRSDRIPEGKSSHTLYLAGKYYSIFHLSDSKAVNGAKSFCFHNVLFNARTKKYWLSFVALWDRHGYSIVTNISSTLLGL